MSHSSGRTHGGERILPFTDAVVAIAMTLLVLPLVDIATAAARHGADAIGPALAQSIGPLIGFGISFVVIARLWWAHHALFEQVERWTTAMVAVNTAWLLVIVLQPWTTALIEVTDPGRDATLLYVGSLTAVSALQTVLALLIVRDEDRPDAQSLEHFYGNLTTLVAFVIAGAICTALPQTHFLPLLLLGCTGLVDRAVRRRLDARDAAGSPD